MSSPFARLRALLADVPPPADVEPVALHLGESRLPAPVVDLSPLGTADAWSGYPPLGGTADLRASVAGWLERRFGVTGLAVEPTPGTKQAVSTVISLAPPGPVVVPDPGYPSYAVAAGEDAVYYDVGAARSDEWILGAIRSAVARAGGRPSAVVLCQPGSPRGEVLTAGGLRSLAAFTASLGALLVVDECYLDLWQDEPVPSLLDVLDDVTGSFLVLHTVSKRSGLPGLRSGFVAGDPVSVSLYAERNRQTGVSSAAGVCAVAARLWADDAHVEQARRVLRENWLTADDLLGPVPGYRRPSAGMFLWLPVADDEAAARHLWRTQGLTAMPGRYLTRDQHPATPGHLRIALVHPADVMKPALARLAAGSGSLGT